ncbi:glutathione S-transferase [Microcella alkaliphila]|uniref:Glutathione S-transferase n=1 Tax=Microcella alkaliphila TaxID=279828 RepID=A0A0U4WT59_9MICO|nr:glutathione S-transferase [Microcella alkaliphila]
MLLGHMLRHQRHQTKAIPTRHRVRHHSLQIKDTDTVDGVHGTWHKCQMHANYPWKMPSSRGTYTASRYTRGMSAKRERWP